MFIENMFAKCWNTCMHSVLGHVYTKLEELFTKWLKICLPHSWNMFTQYLKTYLNCVWGLAKTMIEDIFWQFLKACLHHAWRNQEIIFNFRTLVFIMFQCMFTLHIQLRLQNVWSQAYTRLYLNTYSYNVSRRL